MILDKTVFRPSEIGDLQAIAVLVARAFDRDIEADLVVALLEDMALETRSFVAQIDQQIVGHVVFSQVSSPEATLALGPLSVDPDWRDFQIGTALTRHAVHDIAQGNWRACVTVGLPAFYGRFGFRHDLVAHVRCQYQGPSFLGLEWQPGHLRNFSGLLRYPDAFAHMSP